MTTLTGPLVHHAAHALGLLGVYWPVAWWNDIAVAALLGAIIAGLQRGGGAYLRPRALLWILVHRPGPARLRRVPGVRVGLVLLRRRGGGYEFVHRLLQDYFADLDPAVRSLRARGSVTTKAAPPPGRSRTVTSPPWPRARARQIARPRPAPWLAPAARERSPR